MSDHPTRRTVAKIPQTQSQELHVAVKGQTLDIRIFRNRMSTPAGLGVPVSMVPALVEASTSPRLG